METDTLFANTTLDDLFKAGKGTAKNEQHVCRVDLDELLMGMLASTLRWHRGLSALKNLQQRLLHTFTRNISGDRRILAFASNLVDLVDVDDARLCTLRIKVCGLQQFQQNVLDVFADVTRLGERCRICNRKRHIEHASKSLSEVSLTAAGRSEEQHIRLRQFDFVAASDAGR